jgi:hypothetical protein
LLWRSREVFHRTDREALPVRSPRVERGRLATLPSENSFQLGDCCPVFRSACRADLADAMGISELRPAAPLG